MATKIERIVKLMKLAVYLSFVACVAFLSQTTHAQQVPPIDVKVSVETSSGVTIYHYRVVNNGTHPITALQIGFDYYHGDPELATIPLGVTQAGLPQSTVTSPTGWNVVINSTEDTAKVDLEWSITNPDAAIAPGQSLAGFSVKVPGSDATYTNSHWTVSLNGGGDPAFSAQLSVERLCSAPRLSISVSPNILWPPNHKMIPITATVSVQDDVDPNPIVMLVSIVSNESGNPHDIAGAIGTNTTNFSLMSTRTGTDKAGRVYTITYSAKNYCGNVATATATVSVPHDERK